MKKLYFKKPGCKTLKISFLMTVFVVLFLHSASALVHPGGWFKSYDLELIRTKVAAGEEPWISGWNAIKDTDADENYTPTVSPLISGRSDLSDQGHAAYVLAIKWVASGEQKYADAAINIIDAWVNTVKNFDVEGPTLTLSTAGGHMAQAAEIIAHAFNGEAGWSPTSVAKAQAWFKNVVYPWTSTGASRSLNWGTSCVGGNMSMAIFCDDYVMFEDECDAYRYGYSNTDDGCCGVNQYITNIDGQCYESGRDQVHTQGGIAHLFENALCAWNQGVDLVSYSNYRIVAGMEYTAKYNLGNDVSWQSDIENPCNLSYNWTDGISPDDRGEFSPIYYMAAKLFTLAGVAHPYTAEVVASSAYTPEPTNTSHPGMGSMCFMGTDIDSFMPYLTTEAEDHIAKLGVESTPTTDIRGGYKISSIDVNDWMEYEIEIPLSGTFLFDFRVSGASNGSFTVALNGTNIDDISFDATEGGEIWKTIRSSSPIYLSKGVDTIKITSAEAGWNLNWIQLVAECYESSITPRINTIDLQGGESGLIESSETILYPGFSVDLDPLPSLYGTWSWTGPNGFTFDERVVSISNIQKNQGGEYIAVHTNDCGVESSDTFNVYVQDSLLIEAEGFTHMNSVTVEATSNMGSDSVVNSIVSGSWMEYEVNIPFSALYSFSYRLASDNAGSFDLSIASELIREVTFNSTGGAQTWTTINSDSMIYLEAGVQTIRINSKSNDWKINWFQLKAKKIVSECNLPYINEGFTVRKTTADWSSGLMDISCESKVDVHVIIEGIGTLGVSDYISVYYRLDDGDSILLAEKIGDVSEMMISSEALEGTTLELMIKSHSESSSQYYKVSQIIITNGKDPFARIQAEDYDEAYVTSTETCKDTDGGENIGSTNDGSWLKYSNINLSEIHSVNARLASIYSGATIDVHLDSETGEKIGSLEIPNTGNWQKWETVTAPLDSVVGFYDVYLVFNSSEKYAGNINWLELSSTIIKDPSAIEFTEIASYENILYPNPVKDNLIIANRKGATVEIYNSQGIKVLANITTDSNKYLIAMAGCKPGVYFVVICYESDMQFYRLIKE